MTAKTNLKDVTFLIPLRLDSIDRLENLLEIVDFINRNFDTYIHVLEADEYNNTLLSRLLPVEVKITFEEDFDPVFHRTYYINQLVRKTFTPIVAIWDSDVLVTKEQILEAVGIVRDKKADFASPYKKKALDTSKIVRELYFQTKNFNVLKENELKMKELYAPNPVGGGFFANRLAYLASGLENEFFYGWGKEDGERINRWETLGYKFKRVEGYMYHLTHERGINSGFHSKRQVEIKQAELERLAMMSKEQLLKEMSTWY
ncbi:galactosyltransferase-related protein [Fulvivirgaceae bacterium BMA12]|uniref:Galactosyltransferase-related protein n=1 Tax=Agaribacillus aureus TaxID=3051825 RepID=A0ABT8L7K0_9BACT|nr:galactosyltransferase-related protein [Fulvivirgaceae bacterium BMA12]